MRPDIRDGPRRAVTPNPGGGRAITTSPPPSREAALRVGDGSVSQAVADKLWRLHWDHGYFTRAEIEAALGLDPPPGRWECPGHFEADGRFARHCGGDAA
jgi:hypothetical protein